MSRQIIPQFSDQGELVGRRKTLSAGPPGQALSSSQARACGSSSAQHAGSWPPQNSLKRTRLPEPISRSTRFLTEASWLAFWNRAVGGWDTPSCNSSFPTLIQKRLPRVPCRASDPASHSSFHQADGDWHSAPENTMGCRRTANAAASPLKVRNLRQSRRLEIRSGSKPRSPSGNHSIGRPMGPGRKSHAKTQRTQR